MLKHLMKVASILTILLTSLGSFSASAQNRTISGKVVDTGGQPVIGASVTVVGNTRIGAATDLNGEFTLSVPAGANISVESIGFQTQTFAIGTQTKFNIVLEDDTEMLEETVVIGYGVQKKSDLSGAVASVRGDDLKYVSTSDAAAALQGKASGVHIINNGAPGEGADIRVRGYSSNGGNISPLYIVDGLQVTSIQYLDPSVIESIEILKDGASAAIYGSRAGNGVVLVTTKSGQDGKVSVSYTGRATLQNYTKRPMMNRQEFLKYMTYDIGEAKVAENLKQNDYNHPYYANGVIDQDWIDAYMEPTWSQKHSLSLSGGNKNGHFFAALNYIYDNGVVKGDKDVYNRLTAQINADYNFFKWLQAGANITFERWSTQSVSQRGYSTSFENMLLMDPLTPVYWTDPKEFPQAYRDTYKAVQEGTAEHPYRFLRDENGWFANTRYSDVEGSPLVKRDATDGTNAGFNINGNFFANLKPIKGLTITSRLGFRLNYSSSHNYTAPYYVGSRGNVNTYSISASANTGYFYQWENFATYMRDFGKHSFSIMAGMSYNENNTDNVSVNVSGEDILKKYEENFRYLDYLKDDAVRRVSNTPTKSANLSYLGRLIYTYDNRYNVQVIFRADASDSSKLPKSNRWGYFPSISGYWNISNEPFFKNNVSRDAVSFLKLRASWGRNGNISVLRNYPYASTISIGNTWYQYNVDQLGLDLGSAPGGLPNSNLHWEISEQIDIALESRFLSNRLTFNANFFDKKTRDQLFDVSVPPELGVSSTKANGGTILNRGWEFELIWKDHIGDLNYSVSGNFNPLHNEVLFLPDGASPEYKTDASSTNYQIRTAFEAGYPVWYLNGFIYDGVGPDGAPILRDLNEDGDIGTADMTYIGQGTPKFTYGLNINLSYKGFDFTLAGAGVGGNSILPVLHRPGFKNNLKYYLQNARTPENPNGYLPSPQMMSGDYKFWSSTANLFKGDFFRIKQLQLGYTLPAKITKRAAISNLRFYVSLDDFFTFTSYPGLDPETASVNSTSGTGLDWGSYPTMQKFILGVNLTF